MTLTLIFLGFALINFPISHFYKSADGLKGTHGTESNKTQPILGEMGFAKSRCLSTYVELEPSVTISCGNSVLTDLYSVGIIPSNTTYDAKNKAFSYCGESSSTNVGETKPDQVPPGTESCTRDFLETDKLLIDFQACVN